MHREINANGFFQNEANTQIQQAQGQALTVTQTALAVVGGIIGSSLLTGVAFILIIRYRRNKRKQFGGSGSRRQDRNNGGAAIGYPQLTATSNKAYSISRSSSSSSSVSSSILKRGYFAPPAAGDATGRDDRRSSMYSTDTENNGFRFGTGAAAGIQPPAPAATVGGGGPVGYTVGINNNKGGGFKLSDPPPPRGAAVKAKTAAAATAAAAEGGKFSLFPSSEKDPGPPGSAGQAQAKSRVGSVLSSAGMPSLDKWLRDGTNVSPFATAVKNGNRRSAGSENSLGIGKAR
ncbi:hypothetical protein VTJ49DRAFT_6726 [Mycothermus thermophilus]|uniref:Uncharacterized protein n=1 Tax=Humicola insolens TaxID=85995 RepID=A0ABR3VIX8_HUMIN